MKAPESCKVAQIFGFNDLHISLFFFFLGGGGVGMGMDIIVTLKKESIFRFSR